MFNENRRLNESQRTISDKSGEQKSCIQRDSGKSPFSNNSSQLNFTINDLPKYPKTTNIVLPTNRE